MERHNDRYLWRRWRRYNWNPEYVYYYYPKLRNNLIVNNVSKMSDKTFYMNGVICPCMKEQIWFDKYEFKKYHIKSLIHKTWINNIPYDHLYYQLKNNKNTEIIINKLQFENEQIKRENEKLKRQNEKLKDNNENSK